MNKLLKLSCILICAVNTLSLVGCSTSSAVRNEAQPISQTVTDQSITNVLEVDARRIQAQDVMRPYLVGQSVPLARDMKVPEILSKPVPLIARSANVPIEWTVLADSKLSSSSLAPNTLDQPWTIDSTDVRLVDAFSRWAKKAGVQLRWDAERHVEIGAIDIYEGDIEQAMIAALSSPSIANSDFPLEVCFYPNRPTLARVTRRGEQWRNCPLIQSPLASVDTTLAIKK